MFGVSGRKAARHLLNYIVEAAMSEAYVGHITTVEREFDTGGRYWLRFDATGADALQVAAEAAAYIQRIAEFGELSDIDCTCECPCCRPVAGCDECARWDLACWPHREAYRP
jgi:hypothetical protein